MKKTRTLIVTASLLAMTALAANAATLLTQISVPNRNDLNGTVGMEFTPTADLSVTSLGFQDALGDGLAAAHQVGIWNATTNALVASTTILAGTSSSLIANWRYESIAPVTLTSGQAYYLGAQVFSGGDSWTDAGALPGLGISADAVTPIARFILGSFTAPTNPGLGDGLRWGPGNMQYTVVVPEPSRALLSLVGIAVIGLRRRRR